MIAPIDPSRLAPAEKAALIFAQARSDIAERLWRAALGNFDDTENRGTAAQRGECADFNLDSLLSLLIPKSEPRAFPNAPLQANPTAGVLSAVATAPVKPPANADSSLAGSDRYDSPPSHGGSSNTLQGLGPNVRYREVLASAAARTGIPAAALAAIVDAEAGKDCDGNWNTRARNPRSSAAGLGQFLSGTWQGETERPGTWLNATAASRGWLDGNGRLLPETRSALLALRYDGTAAINATADYASSNIARLRRAGIAIGDDVSSIARAAYIGHHLGAGDSVRFLKTGLDSSRARLLLDAQVGSANAVQRIARAGDAASAHRAWLNEYLDRYFAPAHFGA